MTLNVFRLALVQVYQELLSARRKIGEKSVPCRLGRQKSFCSEDNVFQKRNPIATSVLKNGAQNKTGLLRSGLEIVPWAARVAVCFVRVFHVDSSTQRSRTIRRFAYRPLTQGETKSGGDRDRNSLLGQSKLFLDERRRRCIFTRRNLLGAWESDPKIFTFCPRRRSVWQRNLVIAAAKHCRTGSGDLQRVGECQGEHAQIYTDRQGGQK